MATSLEQREQDLAHYLGEPYFGGVVLGEVIVGSDGVQHTRRTKYFFNGKLEEVDGDCYCFKDVQAVEFTERNPEPQPVPLSDPRSEILRVAETLRGMPYRLDPPPDGINNIDCSRYVLRVYADAGVGFSGVRTAEQIRQACVPIPWEQVQPGDLLFFERTYAAAGPAGPDGKVASHIGISLGAGTQRMWDANSVQGVGVTDISTAYWQGHLLEARRHPALVGEVDVTDTPDPVAPDPDGLTDAPDHQFTLADLWPYIEGYSHEAGIDPRVVTAVIYQESGFTNWRVHRDGTGHGLAGLDDNGLLPSFEVWSGLKVGRGQRARSIPPAMQIGYVAATLARLARDKYQGDPLTAAQEWHRGPTYYNDAAGLNYRRLIETHMRRLFP